MKANEQTIHQIERAIRKIAEKFPERHEAPEMTDIHIRVTQESGEVMAFDDDERELTRCVVEQWIDNKDDNFYEQIAPIFRRVIGQQKAQTEHLALLKPYAFVLEDDEKEPQAELYVVDDETVIIDPILMDGLDKELDDFLEDLMKD